MDGVPGVTQPPVEPGERFDYEFIAPDPGTYFFHPHVGPQLDRGLYAPLIVEDPDEPGDYARAPVLVLDAWPAGADPTSSAEPPVGKEGVREWRSWVLPEYLK